MAVSILYPQRRFGVGGPPRNFFRFHHARADQKLSDALVLFWMCSVTPSIRKLFTHHNSLLVCRTCVTPTVGHQSSVMVHIICPRSAHRFTEFTYIHEYSPIDAAAYMMMAYSI